MRLPLLLAIAILAAACTPRAEDDAAAASTGGDSLMEDIRILAADDMEGRLAGAAGGQKARAYILGRMQAIGLRPALASGFEQRFAIPRGGEEFPGANLIALVEGTSDSNRALLVMAHYDHLGVVSGEIFNGADDNASGVAALLAIGQSLVVRPPAHDVFLVFIDAEEGEALGAQKLVAEPPRPLDDIVLAVNFDMVSRSDVNELYVSGAAHFPWLKPRLLALAATAPVTLKLGHDSRDWGAYEDWTTQSDHVAFHEAGAPWVYFGVENHAGYHAPSDDFASVTEGFFHRSVETLEAAVRAFDADLEAIAADAAR